MTAPKHPHAEPLVASDRARKAAEQIDRLEWTACDGRLNPALLAILATFERDLQPPVSAGQDADEALVKSLGDVANRNCNTMPREDWRVLMRARAALSAIRPAPEAERVKWEGEVADWQPIETAPMDGTPLLLFARCKRATASVVLVGWYLDSMGWIESSFTHPVGIVPTHWQPMPSRPD